MTWSMQMGPSSLAGLGQIKRAWSEKKNENLQFSFYYDEKQWEGFESEKYHYNLSNQIICSKITNEHRKIITVPYPLTTGSKELSLVTLILYTSFSLYIPFSTLF